MFDFWAAFFSAAVFTPLVIMIARRFGAIDVPNVRSSHAVPTPRGGGVAILTATLLVTFVSGLAEDVSLAFMLAATVAIGILGLWDDLVSLRASLRLAIHAAVAVALVSGGLAVREIAWPFWSEPPTLLLASGLAVFWIVAMTNAFNFMDGINGIASVQATVAALALAALLARFGDSAGAGVALATAGAAAGFLPWNCPTARIFMGDAGSGALGFLLASLAVRLTARGGSLLEGALPLLPFVFDTTVTLVRRVSRGERWWEAHRSHLYQKLVQRGFSHTFVTSVWGGLAIASSVVSLKLRDVSVTAGFLILALLLVTHVFLAGAILIVPRAGAES